MSSSCSSATGNGSAPGMSRRAATVTSVSSCGQGDRVLGTGRPGCRGGALPGPAAVFPDHSPDPSDRGRSDAAGVTDVDPESGQLDRAEDLLAFERLEDRAGKAECGPPWPARSPGVPAGWRSASGGLLAALCVAAIFMHSSYDLSASLPSGSRVRRGDQAA